MVLVVPGFGESSDEIIQHGVVEDGGQRGEVFGKLFGVVEELVPKRSRFQQDLTDEQLLADRESQHHFFLLPIHLLQHSQTVEFQPLQCVLIDKMLRNQVPLL